MDNNIKSHEYIDFINEIKSTIINANVKVVRSINSSLIELYYSIGKSITLKQQEAKWGDNIIETIEYDLKIVFPNLKGFSKRNLIYMRQLYTFIDSTIITQQLVAQLPWGHIVLLLDKKLTKHESLFYIQNIIQNAWTRATLELQIANKLYERKGALPNNFETSLNLQDLNIIKDTFKDPYILDFLELEELHKERDFEKALVNNITKFLLELGNGFAFVGQQYKITVSGKEFFLDLLFYNLNLRRYVAIELKTTEFKPEHVGQIGFYVTVINKELKTEYDKDTIGIIICKNKDNTIVEYALGNTVHPTGVSTFTLDEQEVIDKLPSSNDFDKLIKMTEL